MSTPTTEMIAARATVMLDAQALDELGPRTIDRLADLVADRLAERRAAGELPLLTVAQAAQVAGVHPKQSVERSARALWRSLATRASGRGCGERTSTGGCTRPARRSCTTAAGVSLVRRGGGWLWLVVGVCSARRSRR